MAASYTLAGVRRGNSYERLFRFKDVPDSLRVEGGFTFYRPRLSMQVIGHSIEKNEWGAVTGWTLELEEV